MSESGARLVVRALEDEGASWTFGIPGTHNIELYDALDRSETVTPILVTDEQSASFMADGVSRTSGQVGVVNVVPGAGVAHCLSGLAEALLDNVPLVVLACGLPDDRGKAYQLHDIDQKALLKPVTKAVLRPRGVDDVYAAVRRAFAMARGPVPGPVAVEIPANLFWERGRAVWEEAPPPRRPEPDPAQVRQAAALLDGARRPVLYFGNGAKDCPELAAALAEKLGAPSATTIQGKGVFPESHPLWLWNGLGAAAPEYVRAVMASCDCLLAVGCRFGEVATGSYGFRLPERLIHVDIDRSVFHRNYPARLAVEADAGEFLAALLREVRGGPPDPRVLAEISEGRRRLESEGPALEGRIAPGAFFRELQRAAGPDAVYVTDSGNGTFLAMERLRLERPGRFLGPIDFSCMGYAVPAAIGVKLANPGRTVVALPGDGALLMTGLELLTASHLGLELPVCVLRDGELGQIAQFERAALAAAPSAELAPYSLEALARAVNFEHSRLTAGTPLDLSGSRIIEVPIDYSRPTQFTKGVLETNFWRLPLGRRLRMLARAAGRRLAAR